MKRSLTAFHVSTSYVDVQAGGTYDSFTLTLGARLSRTEVHASLIRRGRDRAPERRADPCPARSMPTSPPWSAHAAPNGCTSRQTVKNVLAGRSRGVFQGKIEVAREAQKTDGYQMNQALLLSPDAEIDSKPELEIFADDVKCSHGATVGELDAEQMFYLRSRGIPDAEAQVHPRARLSGGSAGRRRGRGDTAARLDKAVDALVGKAESMNVMTNPAVLDVDRIRADFPILAQTIRGKPSGVPGQRRLRAEAARGHRRDGSRDGDAIRQCPSRPALDERAHHRGLRSRARRGAELMNATDRSEVMFTGNSTGSDQPAGPQLWPRCAQAGQAVLISGMEHHSNIVPWQMLRDAHGIELRVAPVTDAGELDMPAYEALLADGKVGLVAITHMSNVLGTIICRPNGSSRIAHAHGAKVMFDGSQAIVHRKVDVQALDCDFYVWTGHKLYGPTGIGVLWGKRELLDRMPPFMGGGDMISRCTYEQSTWAAVPHKFEAGTPAILEGIGLKAAIDYVQAIGYDAMAAHEAAIDRTCAGPVWAAIEGLRMHWPGAGSRRRHLVHAQTRRTPMMSPRCWTARASRCAPGIIARNR